MKIWDILELNSSGDKDMTFMMPVFLDTNEINNWERWLFESRKFHLEDLPKNFTLSICQKKAMILD